MSKLPLRLNLNADLTLDAEDVVDVVDVDTGTDPTISTVAAADVDHGEAVVAVAEAAAIEEVVAGGEIIGFINRICLRIIFTRL